MIGQESLDGKITSDIESARNVDGRLEIFARGTNGAVYHNSQKSKSSAEWSG